MTEDGALFPAGDAPPAGDRPFVLGDPVEFSRTLRRRRGTEPPFVNRWTPERWHGDTEPLPWKRGLLIGVRRLANGRVLYGYDEPTVFEPEEYLTAYLVAFHLRRAPVLVLPEHLRRLS